MRARMIGLIGLLAVAACGSPPPAGDAGAGPSLAEPPTGTSTEVTGANGATSPATTASRLPVATDCKTDELSLSIEDDSAGAGTVYRKLVFTNTGSRVCVLHGFPGVSYVSGEGGEQVGPAAYREGTKGAPVTLKPDGTAVAPVGFVNVRNYDAAVCKPTEVRGLRVYPPQETAAMFVALDGLGCAGNPPGNQLVVKTITRS
ncbi:hypothetical protein Actkin_00130 [Actinokineospora sp. UTMC 2448]|nr:hypothetical protein Actkin_00130 [Actinokineospora sp. UTMC 2448]